LLLDNYSCTFQNHVFATCKTEFQWLDTRIWWDPRERCSSQHCYKLLEHSEKWKIRDREAPPARGALVELDDDEEEDELEAKKNKKRPNGCKKEKDKQKKQAESSSIRGKMDDMMKSREHLVNKTLETKVMLMDKKIQEKQMRSELLREDEKLKAAIDERRPRAEEKHAMAELIAEENKTMMMDPSLMDEFTKE
jgi:hypothetical protein